MTDNDWRDKIIKSYKNASKNASGTQSMGHHYWAVRYRSKCKESYLLAAEEFRRHARVLEDYVESDAFDKIEWRDYDKDAS